MEQTDTATRRTKRVAKPSMTGIRPYRTQSRRILTHPNTRHTTIRGTRSQQIKPVLLQQPFRMLRGNRKPLFQRERQTLVGIDQLARNIGLAIDVASSRMRLDHQVKRAFRRFETILRKKTGNIARRHRGETSHAIDRRTRDQRFRETNSRVGTNRICVPKSESSNARMSGRAKARNAAADISATSG